MRSYFCNLGWYTMVWLLLLFHLPLAQERERSVANLPEAGSSASAKRDTIIAEGRFIMGDNDTRTEARQYALLDAKRKVMEQVGTFLQSYSKVENFRMTEQEIESFSAGFIQTEIIEERVEPVGETVAVMVRIRAIIDPDDVRRRLTEFQEQPGHADALMALQEQYQVLAAELDSLKQRVDAAPTTQAHPDPQKTAPVTTPVAQQRSRSWKEMKQVELLIQLVAESNKRMPSLKRMEQILEQLETGIPGRGIIYGYYGIALFKHGNIREAMTNLERAIQAKPRTDVRPPRPRTARLIKDRFQKEQALFHYYLARCYQRIQRPRLAIRHLKIAQRLDPRNPQYRKLKLPER